MTKHEIYFFSFVIIFFLTISLVKSLMEKVLMKWVYKLKLMVRAIIIFFLIITVCYLLDADLTQKFVSLFVDGTIIALEAAAAAFEVVATRVDL